MFQAYCPHCEKRAANPPVLGRNEVPAAPHRGGDILVAHAATGGDHQWNLSKWDKTRLRKAITEGMA